MQNRRVGLVLAGLAVVAAAVLLIVLSGGDDDTATTADLSPATIVIEDGQAVGGVQDLEFSEGEDIRFEVQSDEDHEIHFHGYDIAKDVEAGGSVEFEVPARIPGVFEVELEETATQIAEITVD